MWLPASVATPSPARASAARWRGIGRRRRDVDAARHAARGVRHLDLADHEVGRAEELAARLEERVRVGLVEDQVAEKARSLIGGLRSRGSTNVLDNPPARHERLLVPVAGVGVVRVDLEHGDAGVLERARDEVAAPRLGGDEVDDAVDAVRRASFRYHGSAQPGIPSKSVNAANRAASARSGGAAVAGIAVGCDREVHRPDEDGAVPLWKCW